MTERNYVELQEFARSYWPSRTGFDPRLRVFARSRLQHWKPSTWISRHSGAFKIVTVAGDGSSCEEITSRHNALAAYPNHTCCLVAAHIWCPLLRELIDELSSALTVDARFMQCNVYLSPPGCGTPLHFDDHEVFIAQLVGEKSWVVADNTEVYYPTCNYVSGEEVSRDLKPYFTGVSRQFRPPNARAIQLSPGAWLFIPRGTWHETDALIYSISLSIGVFVPTALDLVVSAIRQSLLDDPELRRPTLERDEAERLYLLGAKSAKMIQLMAVRSAIGGNEQL